MFKKFKQLLTIFTITCGFITNNSLAAQENNNKKLLLNNGVIYTANSQNQHPQAIGIINGEIIAIGSEKEVQTKLGKDFQTLDLKGNFLMPGLIDTHVHVGFAGFQMTTTSFPENLKTSKEITNFVESVFSNPQTWIEDVMLFSNVSLAYWDNISILKESLNSGKFKEIPIILAGSDAHTGWCNEAMLKKAKLTKESIKSFSKDIQNSFGKNKNGTLNGFVSEGAWDEVLKHAPIVSEEKISHAIKSGADYLNSYGITAWMDPIANIRPLSPIFNASPNKNDVGLLPSYKKLIEKKELNAHVSALLLVNINSDASIVKDVLDIKNKFELLPDLSIKGVKILQDGVIEYPSQTAKLSESYIGKGDYSGPLNIDKNKYENLIAEIDKAGLMAHAHTIGDRATKEFLDAISYARNKNNNYDLNHSVTHLEVVNPKDFKRFKELGIDCSMQFLWAGKSAPTTTLLEGSVPDNLLKVLYPANSLIKSGALVAGASDWPVSTPNPFLAIHTALTRMGDEGVLLPKNEIISRDDILKAYTINAANLIGYGDKIGSIEIGKKADFTLLDKNLEEVSVNEIPKTKVIWTMFNGTIIYSIN